jgi:putative NADPH-quinone reductase
MKCLVVVAHPLAQSLCAALAAQAADTLRQAGHQVQVEELYAAQFHAALTAAERASYYAGQYDARAVQAQIDRLLWAQALVLVFPTWWFGMPAMLKGWFDRVWAPGVAYDHASDLGAIKPRLLQLERALAVTSLGAAGWIDHLVMRQPVKRQLQTALLRTCAPQCRFRMLSLYKSERLSAAQVAQFSQRVHAQLARW